LSKYCTEYCSCLYNADTPEYLNLIPIIQKMVDSFWYCDYASKNCIVFDDGLIG
jgi:hypothetical protein